jgi:HEAT repeat protein
MMWFKKPYRNVVGLSKTKLEELLENLEKLKEFGGDIFDRVVRYVLDGEDEAILSELAVKAEAPARLQLLAAAHYGAGGRKAPWGSFFRSVELVDCRFYLRLAKVLEAAVRSLPANQFFCQNQLDNNLWLELLLQESTGICAQVWTSAPPIPACPAEMIKEMLKADGRSIDYFVTAAFRPGGDKWNSAQARNMLLAIRDLGECYATHRELIIPFLREGSASSRLIAVENLAHTKAPVKAFLEEIVDCATDSSKLLREAAESLLLHEPEAARPFLEKATTDTKAARREQAVRLLVRIYGEGARALLEEMRSTEKSAGVKEAIAGALRELERKCVIPPIVTEVPSHEPIPLHPPVTQGLRGCLEKLFAQYNLHATRMNEKIKAVSNPPRGARKEFPLLYATELDHTCRFLQDGGVLKGTLVHTLGNMRYPGGQGACEWKAIAEHPDCALIHLVRLHAMAGGIGQRNSGYMDWHSSVNIDCFRATHTPRITLAQLAEAVCEIGMSDEGFVEHILDSYHQVFRWETEAVWPYLSDKIKLFEKTFEPAVGDWYARWRRKRAFDNALRLLATIPQVPPKLVGKLWDMAIGSGKADRLRAQKVVVNLPDLADRILQALSARSSETRAVVAEWIGRLGDRQYAAALHKAARAEKIDAALDEMLTALEQMGEDVEQYLDRDKLRADAEKNLKKGTSPALEWFPWGQLPVVRWQDSGKAVPKEVVTWLIVQNYKFKSPEAGPLLRRYCAMISPVDRTELGQFVLRAWLDQDLKRKYTDAECRAEAQKQAPPQFQQFQQALQWYQQQGQTPPGSYSVTQQQIEESIFQQLQRECGTAVSEKGILAVAGACCDASAVWPVQKYLKNWYGHRAAQCKALIAMLSSIDHPSATQFLLSIANRFRTKGIREEAEKYVNLLAERKGWSLDELADRTLPTAGFEDDGTLELSFGPRQFQVRVTPNLEAVLTDCDGKTLKALPVPRKEDDEEQAKTAKKAFSAAKAELKKFAGLQTTRMYEAMCTQRIWTAADWQTYLIEHPLMKFLCQRLVWAVCDGDRVQSTFRPLDDGTLTDVEDNEVQLPAEAKLRIAHSCQVSPESAAAWARHLADYGVTPLFTQFGRTTYSLPEEKRKETAINDFEGHLVEAFKFRSLATKLGYTRGQAQDGGWFYDYLKSFPGLGLKVVLEFSGNSLPEDNRIVAMKQIYFQQAAAEEGPLMQMSGGMALGEVPAVLLSECYNDFRTIAAAGTGFDPEWKKTVGY